MFSLILLAAIKKSMACRYDGAPNLRYFTPADFGMKCEPFSFKSGKWLLRGERVFPEGEPKALLVFFHGLGAGHSAYTQEICALAKQGYLVYAYDNTGCMTSEGDVARFFPQSLLDQEAFFSYLDEQEKVRDLPRYAAGHSWGGFTALGALDERYHVQKVVCISGFLSVASIVFDVQPKLAKFEKWFRKAMKIGYGKYGNIDMLDMIDASNARVLYVAGENDPMVRVRISYDELNKRFQKQKRVETLLVPDALHQPYWTLEAQAYYHKIKKEHHLFEPTFDNSFAVDYSKLNEDEPKVMAAIFDFLAR